MSGNKTVPTKASVKAFVERVPQEEKRNDCFKLLEVMHKVTGEKPVMWGPGIVGFGTYHYRYDSGREGDMLMTGFSPRSQTISLYIMSGFGRYAALLQKLGKYKTGKSCLYIKRLSDINMDIMEELIRDSYNHCKSIYNT